MNFSIRLLFSTAFISALLLTAGCATTVVEKPSAMNPPTERLGSFDTVVLVASEMGAPYAGQGANEKAKKKIDEEILNGLSSVFGASVNFENVSSFADAQSVAKGKTVVIQPVIKQIKFVNATARVWAGAMAGSSVVVMDVKYIDLNSGEQIGIAGFQRVASAYSGAFGIADNRMLSDTAQDVVTFTRSNY